MIRRPSGTRVARLSTLPTNSMTVRVLPPRLFASTFVSLLYLHKPFDLFRELVYLINFYVGIGSACLDSIPFDSTRFDRKPFSLVRTAYRFSASEQTFSATFQLRVTYVSNVTSTFQGKGIRAIEE